MIRNTLIILCAFTNCLVLAQSPTIQPNNDSIRVAFLAADSIHIADSMAAAMVNSLGKPGYVNDFEKIIDNQTEKSLTNLIALHEGKTTNQICIVTIDNANAVFNGDFDKYSVWLANYWRVGQKGKNNGVLISVSKNLRKIRISVGYGLEKILPDKECKRIINTIIIPELKKGDYNKGIKNGLAEIIKILEH
jgi:uncharacterized protein